MLTSNSFNAQVGEERVGVTEQDWATRGHSSQGHSGHLYGWIRAIFVISKIIKSFVKTKQVELKMNTAAKELLVDEESGKVIESK